MEKVAGAWTTSICLQRAPWLWRVIIASFWIASQMLDLDEADASASLMRAMRWPFRFPIPRSSMQSRQVMTC